MGWWRIGDRIVVDMLGVIGWCCTMHTLGMVVTGDRMVVDTPGVIGWWTC